MTEEDSNADGTFEDSREFPTSEELDEDRLGIDPMEAGIEPPENWTEAEQSGNTAAEQQEGESLDQRLAREQPDQELPEANQPLATTPVDELDESIDEVAQDNVSDLSGEPFDEESDGQIPAAEREDNADAVDSSATGTLWETRE